MYPPFTVFEFQLHLLQVFRYVHGNEITNIRNYEKNQLFEILEVQLNMRMNVRTDPGIL
jgi:hypothetical protein